MKKLVMIFTFAFLTLVFSSCEEDVQPNLAPSGSYDVSTSSPDQSDYNMSGEVNNGTITIFIEQEDRFDQKEDRKYHMATIVFQQIEGNNWSMSLVYLGASGNGSSKDFEIAATTS